jgi:hypothetical protein
MQVINLHPIADDWVHEKLVKMKMESAAVRVSHGLSEHTTTRIA